LSNVATELYQPIKLLVADADAVDGVQFGRQLGVLHHSQIIDNVDLIRNYETDKKGYFVIC